MSTAPKSGLRNVSWHSATKQWKVEATIRGKAIFGGYHDTLEAAATEAALIRAMHRNPRGYLPPSKRPWYWTPCLTNSHLDTGPNPERKWREKMAGPGAVGHIWHPLDHEWWAERNPVDYTMLAIKNRDNPLCVADVNAAPTFGHSQFVLDALWETEKFRRDADPSGARWQGWGYEIKWPESESGNKETDLLWPVRLGEDAHRFFQHEVEAARGLRIKLKTITPPMIYEPAGAELCRHSSEAKYDFWRKARNQAYDDKTRFAPWRLAEVFEPWEDEPARRYWDSPTAPDRYASALRNAMRCLV